MNLLQTIHELNPLWVLIPAGLFFAGYLLDQYAGRGFKKSETQALEDQAQVQRKERLRILLWREKP